jgi:hypothetical protein
MVERSLPAAGWTDAAGKLIGQVGETVTFLQRRTKTLERKPFRVVVVIGIIVTGTEAGFDAGEDDTLGRPAGLGAPG